MMEKCKVCSGYGQIESKIKNVKGKSIYRKCIDCNGSGDISSDFVIVDKNIGKSAKQYHFDNRLKPFFRKEYDKEKKCYKKKQYNVRIFEYDYDSFNNSSFKNKIELSLATFNYIFLYCWGDNDNSECFQLEAEII